MGIRLNKVISELNIGLQTAVEFLKNHHIGVLTDDVKPYTKISDEQYNALVKHFRVDMRIKANAEALANKLFAKNENSVGKGKKKKNMKDRKGTMPIRISIETKEKWAKQKRKRTSLYPNRTFTRDESPTVVNRKDVKSLKKISSIKDVDDALEFFTWPSLKYNRDDDWYLQDLIGANDELMAYYHHKMRGYFGLEHALKKEYAKKKPNIVSSIKDVYIPKNISTEPEYSEAWLPQPLAAMVVRGLTRFLKWPNLSKYEHGEKVLIYALHSTKRTRNLIWADDALYSSYHNALQMGNLLEKEIPEHVYVGYVVIGAKLADDYYEIQDAVAFKTLTSTKPKYLNNLGEDKRMLKRLSLENRILKIPVNDDVWSMLERKNGTYYFYWENTFNDFYSEEFGCGDSKGQYEIVLYNDKEEKVCAQEDKAAIQKKTYISKPDGKEFEAFVLSFHYLREKSKYEESSFKVMKRIEWILDWNCVKFKNGYFVVLPPDNGEVKFKPKAFPYKGVIESFNYLKEYLNERLSPIRCYAEALDLTIYDKIRLEEAIQRFAAISKQRAIKTTNTNQQPKEVPEQMTFKQALSKAMQMTPEEFEKYKSEYINYLVKKQSKEYKVIPCVERLAHSTGDMTEFAFIFSLECGNGNIMIVHENVNPDRSTLIFEVKKGDYNKSIRSIYDFLQSAEINKRSSLRERNIEIKEVGVIRYRSINHDNIYQWKRTLTSCVLYNWVMNIY